MDGTHAAHARPPRAGDGSPVPARERIEIVDVLRGFALFGILQINLTAFANPGGPPGLGFTGGSFDRVVLYGLVFLVESKFFTLFSFLFGLGFAIQLGRAKAKGAAFVPRFSRRLLALLAFGVLHIVFLWDGDILLLYALVGFLLLPLRDQEPRALLAWATRLLAVPLALVTLAWLGVLFAGPALEAGNREFAATFQTATREAIAVYGSGSYGAVLQERLEGYASTFVLLLTRVPTVLAMFVLGLYVGRSGILERPAEHGPLLRRVRFWGLAVGLPLSLAVTIGYALLPPIAGIVTLLFNQALVGPVLSMGYAASVVLLAQRPGWADRLRPLAWTGRMALTNYLGQSLILTLVFNGYGLGLVGKLTPTQGVLLGIAVYAAQELVSRWWLGRFQFGPMEWLWRGLTYGSLQPLRRPSEAA